MLVYQRVIGLVLFLHQVDSTTASLAHANHPKESRRPPRHCRRPLAGHGCLPSRYLQ